MKNTIRQTQFLLTPAEQALLPSEEDIRFYETNGYYVSQKIVPDDLLDSVLEASERYYSGQVEEGPPVPSECLPTGEPYSGLRQHCFVSLRCSEIRKLAHFPLVAATAARLARVDEIRLWRDFLLFKPTGMAPKTRVGWHRDRAYWLDCTSSKMMTAWIPLTSISQEMGALQVIPGSNHWRFEGENARRFGEQNLEQQEAQLAAQGLSTNPVPVVLEKGQVSFHSCLVMHASSENTSTQPRRSFAMHLQDGDNRFREAFLKSGENLRWNSELVRRDDRGLPDFTDPVYCPILWRESDAGVVDASNSAQPPF